MQTTMKQIELYGGPYDGLNVKIPANEMFIIFEAICFREGCITMITEIYQSINKRNCKGIEMFERENRVNV